MSGIEVLRGGAATTVQDLGREGFESSGVPSGGAFDPWAARAANRLVGNDDGSALFEITLAGPTLRFDTASIVALVGDDFELRVNGVAASRDESVAVPAGGTLEIGRARSGVRSWLAIRGGIDVPLVLGSRSTELAAGFGGHEGRPIRSGDRLSLFPSMKSVAFRRLDSAALSESRERSANEETFRFLPGPDQRSLGGEGASALAARSWRVSPRSDRRGVRLEGEPIGDGASEAGRGFMRSIPMLPGAIELTPAGEPILLGVDAPVTGGYPWVAQVIAADAGSIGRLAPGSFVRFEPVSLDAADRALERREQLLARAVTESERR